MNPPATRIVHGSSRISTAPTAMLLYSLVVRWFSRAGHRYVRPPTRLWYVGKADASFAAMAATLRRQDVKAEVSSMHLHGRGSRNVPKVVIG